MRLTNLIIASSRAVSERLKTAINALYTSPDPKLRKYVLPPVSELQRQALFFTKGLFFRIVVFEGRPSEDDSGDTLRAAVFGTGSIIDYFKQAIYGDAPVTRESRGQCLFWQAAGMAKRLAKEVDLVVIERVNMDTWQPASGEWVITPHRHHMVTDIDLSESWEERKRKMKKQQHGNFSRIAKENFKFIFTHEEEDFNLFYDQMYLPMVMKRHGYFPVIETREEAHRLFQAGVLALCINQERQPVAGDLLGIEGEVLVASLTGVLDGSDEWVRRGAASALYVNGFLYCYEKNLKRYDVGPCFPFLKDGVYIYKRRWGFYPSPDLRWYFDWLFWAPDGSEIGQRWLCNHPFVRERLRYSGKKMAELYREQPADIPEREVSLRQPSQ